MTLEVKQKSGNFVCMPYNVLRGAIAILHALVQVFACRSKRTTLNYFRFAVASLAFYKACRKNVFFMGFEVFLVGGPSVRHFNPFLAGRCTDNQTLSLICYCKVVHFAHVLDCSKTPRKCSSHKNDCRLSIMRAPLI